MDRELEHPLANLLASIADEWFRYYGATDAQARQMHGIIEQRLNQIGGAS